MTKEEYMKERESAYEEQSRINAETRKLLSESFFYEKKTKWYEATLFLALGVIIATLAIKFA
jgi:hypothetical protein